MRLSLKYQPINAVYCENYKKHGSTSYGRNADFNKLKQLLHIGPEENKEIVIEKTTDVAASYKEAIFIIRDKVSASI